MNLVKKYVLPVLFLSVLAVNTRAGVLETPGYVPPPPPPSSSMSTTSTDETTTVSTDSTQQGDDISEPTDILLYDALMTVLSLF